MCGICEGFVGTADKSSMTRLTFRETLKINRSWLVYARWALLLILVLFVDTLSISGTSQSQEQYVNSLLTSPATKPRDTTNFMKSSDAYTQITPEEPENFEDKELAKMEMADEASGETNDRQPASKPKGKLARNSKWKKVHSRLPSTAEEGFEYRFKMGQLISAFWVLKQGERFSISFANNKGTKAAVGLTKDNYRYLHSSARGIASVDGSHSPCKNGQMQVLLFQNRKLNKVISSCLASKNQTADEVRRLGNILSAIVR